MTISERLPATTTRVERHTEPQVNDVIRGRTDAELIRLQDADRAEIDTHLALLDREWDVERVLQANASTLVLVGVMLGVRVDRRFLALPLAVWGFLAQHALQGWCPPIPIIRRLGVRTVRELERERYALKAMRGDFDSLPERGSGDAQRRVKAVLKAIDA